MKKGTIIGIVFFVVIIIGYMVFRTNQNLDEKSVIKIGSILPLTGDYATYATKAKNGYDSAISEINQKETPKIEIIYEDSKGTPKDALNAYNKLKFNKVNTIIGLLSSPVVLAVAPIAEKDKIILFSTGASSPDISKAGKYIFRNVPSDIYEAKLMASYMYKRFKKNITAVLYINNDYGIGVFNEFIDTFKKHGGSIRISENYNKGTINFRTQLSKIIKSNPDALYLVGYTELGLIVNQFKELGGRCQIFSTALFEDQEILKTAGKNADGIIFTSITFDNDSKDPNAVEFRKNYYSKYGKYPDGFAAVAYDGIKIVYDALKNNPDDTEKVVQNLLNVNNYNGLLGNLNFDKNGDVILPIKLKIVDNNNFKNFE